MLIPLCCQRSLTSAFFFPRRSDDRPSLLWSNLPHFTDVVLSHHLNAAALTVDDPPENSGTTKKQKTQPTSTIKYLQSSNPSIPNKNFDRFVSWICEAFLDPKKISQLSNKKCQLPKTLPSKTRPASSTRTGHFFDFFAGIAVLSDAKRRPIDTHFLPNNVMPRRDPRLLSLFLVGNSWTKKSNE